MNIFIYRLGKNSFARPILMALHNWFAWLAGFFSMLLPNVGRVFLSGSSAIGAVVPGISDIDLWLVLKKDILRVKVLDVVALRYCLGLLTKLIPGYSFPFILSSKELEEVAINLFLARTNIQPEEFKIRFRKSKFFNHDLVSRHALTRKAIWYLQEYQQRYFSWPQSEIKNHRLLRFEARIEDLARRLEINKGLAESEYDSLDRLLLLNRKLSYEKNALNNIEFEIFHTPKADSSIRIANLALRLVNEKVIDLLGAASEDLPVKIYLTRDGILQDSENLNIVIAKQELSGREFLTIVKYLQPLLADSLQVSSHKSVPLSLYSSESFEAFLHFDIERRCSLLEKWINQDKISFQSVGIVKQHLAEMLIYNRIHVKQAVFEKSKSQLSRYFDELITSTVFMDLLLNHNKIVLDKSSLFDIYRRVSEENYKLIFNDSLVMRRKRKAQKKLTHTEISNCYCSVRRLMDGVHVG